tara:strand:+ start:19 stop:1314 length:1296 start_codon:yes stop_codon:yes gene_type:complete
MSIENTTAVGGFVEALKETYEDGIKDQLNRDVVLYDALQAGTKKVKLEGSELVFSTKLGRAYGAHAISEGGTLPSAGTATRAKGRVKPKDVWGRAQLSKRLMAVSKTDRGAFADALADKMDDLQEDLKYEVARALVGNKPTDSDSKHEGVALTGLLGQLSASIGGAPGSATVALDNNSANVQLRPGMPIVVGTISAGAFTAEDTGVIQSIDTTTQITTQQNLVSVSDNAYIVRGDSLANAFNEEFTGIAHIVDDTDTLYGISPTDAPQWAAYVDDNGGVSRPWSHDIMNKAFRSIKTQSGKRPDYVTGHDAQVDEIANTLVSDVRYEPCKFKGGYERSFLTWNNGERDIPIVPDDMFEPGKLTFLSMDCLAMCETVPMGFDETDSLLQRISNSVSYEIVYGTIGNMVCYQRNAHGVLEDLQFDETNFAFAS